MLKLQVLLRLRCLWTLLLMPQLASARSPIHPETRVGVFEVASELCTRVSGLANSSGHQENADASTAEAVGYPHATKGAAGAERLAIGRGKDLANGLKAGETKLQWPSKLPNFKAEWKMTSGLLRQWMQKGQPIRDVSPGDTGGIFLNAERNLLQSRGWTFESGSGFWLPPGG